MSKSKIVYFDSVFDEFKDIFYRNAPASSEVVFWDELSEDGREAVLPEAEYLMVATKDIPESLLQRAENARFIQKTGIGVDNIDLGAADKLELPVSNTPGGNASGVAELSIMFILSLYRKLPLINQETKAGSWPMWKYRSQSFEMGGKTHGFIGFGNIGQETARRSQAFGTNIVYYDVNRLASEAEEELGARYLELDQLLREADILSLHLPLIPATKGLISERELKLMKKSAVLINVSRGGVVHEGDLAEALKNGQIAGAGIDVWENEPPSPDNPLLKLENVIATPHIGAGTRDTLSRVLKIAFDNIAKAERGENPDFVVNSIKQLRQGKLI
ncbi:2-hydroxyacid dehydrogenase [Evansella sp. LMS18]|uniref:2-hydroxyacid dehydrogenase n=1 Tax=Evansella sp. LMS18 TaxID=2924033 RepID=UPI0020D0B876|nr:2-hydroxyacid dehydrogenase [Evansella sp. LMS18]UTR11934.1 2-hydroxyacid dehydrogenase [Evansella sp. LMS18]